MTSSFLSCPLDFRYGRPELKAIFSEEGKLERLLAVEASLARAHARVGNVPESAAQEISKSATTRLVTPDRVKEIEAEIRHDLMAVVKALSEQCSPEAARFVHLGATSYDIIDTANALMFKDGLAHVESGLLELRDALAALARAHRDTVMMGRTHGQAALPTTFGHKVAVWLLETQRHVERLREARARVVVGKMAGAVGTAAGFGPEAFDIEEFVAADLGVGMEEGATQIVQRDRYNELFSFFANVSASLEKFATEVRTLQRSEIDEVAEGFDVSKQVGSSTMAQKRNPVTCEKISGLARVVRSNVTPAFENSIQWNERDLANSSAERFIIPHAFVLTDQIVRDAADVFRNLVVKPENMRRNLEANPGVMAESVLLALTRKGMGRQEAHEHVRQVAMRSRDFFGELRQDETVRRHLSEEELEDAIDFAKYTGHAGAFVDRALTRVEKDA